MTKYVSFKIFDSEDHPNGFEGIKDKQIKKYYTWVHEDYFEGIIREHLRNGNMIVPDEYYVKKEDNLLVLRQTRFKERLVQGKKEHPHDVMAYAHDEKEMQGMINTIKGWKND